MHIRERFSARPAKCLVTPSGDAQHFRLSLFAVSALRPRDYWQNFDNLRTEILEFIQDHNLNPKEFPPRRTFIEYNRMDIVRAYTKWSGPSEVASSLGLRHSSGNAKSVLPGLEEEGRDAQDKSHHKERMIGNNR